MKANDEKAIAMKKNPTKLLPACFVFCIISFSFSAWGATYYVAPPPLGKDTNAMGFTTPGATFKHAFTVMKSGDTLIAKNGTYNQTVGEWRWSGSVMTPTSMPPNGTPSAFTTVKSESVGGAIINEAISIIGISYIRVEGFKALGGVAVDGGSHHIEIKKVGAKGGIGTARSSYILKEDVWAWGKDRYVIENYGSHHIIDNRVIARLDDMGGTQPLPVGAINHYLTNYSVIANALLFDVSGTFSQPFYLLYSSRPDVGFNQIWGVIGFNAGPLGGLFPGHAGEGGHQIHNSVVWGTTGHHGVRFSSPGPNGLFNSTVANNKGNAFDGGMDITANNNIFYKNNGFGAPATSCHNNFFLESGSLTGCTNSDITTTNLDIKYLPRSPIAGKGATIEKRYSISEVNGVFVVTETDKSLWPWPYEEIIKADLCAGGITKGLCGTPKTLTQYVWEYLGNKTPPEYLDKLPPAAPLGLVVR